MQGNEVQQQQALPKLKRKQREEIAGYLLAGPMLLGLFIFTVIPTLISLVLSFTEWSFIADLQKMKFVGLNNFKQLFDDQVFLTSMRNNLILLLVVPVQLIVSLVLAVVIERYVYGKGLFKVMFFMPYISSMVAVAIVFQLLFHPSYGPVNETLRSLGIANPPKWLADLHYALPSVMIILIWVGIGFCMVVYMAALNAIPKDLYESADIDGAGVWTRFRRITLPLVTPTTFFLLVTGLISSFKSFDVIKVLTEGGPSYSTSVVTYYLYTTAFENLKTGYASSIAWMLFGCVLLITLIQLYGQKKWVHY
ncbi:carbohydrate ABC transporter permease [Paenibacillus radicis (ex Gao et al. 2016)]|uniref:Binding-protein-dependent transport system inner membrane protein n=1 Tax=Paenibacillus radicis (ex Gao et al. 2016) TaxID=1737354 RepID=A0A917HHW6_9BACL|nr:sugar ABC transporter permease [Paenibacillus radicis (ex Gao et al. 2016)]GGG79145.1 binding-protein-dependent transport system inner membrane protein [Paenibacillus radicis (ex Gao et al. 2016)]